MENKQLIEEHKKVIDWYALPSIKSSEITLEHMKGFAEWVDSQNEGGGISQFSNGKWYIVNEIKGDIKPKKFADSTEQLIELYFESLNKK